VEKALNRSAEKVKKFTVQFNLRGILLAQICLTKKYNEL